MQYTLRICTLGDFDLLFNLKQLCMKWYIEIIYGWNDDVQRIKTHNELNRNIENMKVISVDGKDIVITTFIKDEIYRVGLIMIHPDYQNKGIATQIISGYIAEAKRKNRRLVIKTFKENPAKRLYERLGFTEYDADKTHIHMEILP